jgi:hypothetical protein
MMQAHGLGLLSAAYYLASLTTLFLPQVRRFAVTTSA